jgi:hypothetical protein
LIQNAGSELETSSRLPHTAATNSRLTVTTGTSSSESEESLLLDSRLLLDDSNKLLATGGSFGTAAWTLYPRSYLKSYKLLFVEGKPEKAAALMERFLVKFVPVLSTPSYAVVLATTHLFNCYNFMHDNVYFLQK